MGLEHRQDEIDALRAELIEAKEQLEQGEALRAELRETTDAARRELAAALRQLAEVKEQRDALVEARRHPPAVNTWEGRALHVRRDGTAALVSLAPLVGEQWVVWELSGGGSKLIRISCDDGVITLEEIAKT